jgi:hypothetical protein
MARSGVEEEVHLVVVSRVGVIEVDYLPSLSAIVASGRLPDVPPQMFSATSVWESLVNDCLVTEGPVNDLPQMLFMLIWQSQDKSFGSTGFLEQHSGRSKL